jgi:ribosomal protein S1
MVVPELAQEASLQPRSKVRGTVIRVTLAGAVVDIGQRVPGVIHISQLQQGPVNKVDDVIREGQVVEAWVRRLRNDRIELTMVEPLLYDWKEIKPDQIVKGRVTRIEAYGAFVDFGAERPGLVHVSELSRGYVKSASDVVKEGDEVEAKVLDVDRRKRQIRLSLKALQAELPEEKAEAPEPRPSSRRRTARREESIELEPEAPPSEPELTAMQVAWQQALEGSKATFKGRRVKPAKRLSQEQEEILNRTLEKRIITGG